MKLPNRNQVLFAIIAAAVLLAVVPARMTAPVRRQIMPVAGLLRDLSHTTLLTLHNALPKVPDATTDLANHREAELEHQVIALEARLLELSQTMNELAMIEALLDDGSQRYQPLAARILIRNDLAQIAQTLVVNAGTKQGVDAGMAVVRGTSVVGVVESAGTRSCTVRMLTDARFRAAALGMDSRVQGILAGTGTPTMILRFVSVDTPLQTNEIILSSGLDNVFPKGFLLGTVIESSDPDQNKELDIKIEPSLQFSDLESVVILRPLQ